MILKELIKSLNKSNFTMNLIGLILIGLLVSLYLYHNPKTIENKNIISVKGELNKIPQYVNGGENRSYISIYLKDHKKMFVLNGCGFDIVNKNLLYKMNIGDNITLFVDKDEYNEKYGFLNKTVAIRGVKTDNTKILTVSMINNCEQKAWKRLLWLTLFLGIILIIKIGIEINKLKKEKMNSYQQYR